MRHLTDFNVTNNIEIFTNKNTTKKLREEITVQWKNYPNSFTIDAFAKCRVKKFFIVCYDVINTYK